MSLVILSKCSISDLRRRSCLLQYYCLYDQFGETGEGCDGGKYRCEANAASNVVYGILASYPVPTAIYGYCKTSTDCEASQFCDFMPQRNFSGDNVYGNCVDFLVQGCLA